MLYSENNFYVKDNIIYSIDMIRLRCDITYDTYSKLESMIRTVYSDQIKNYYISLGISDFKYNYNIEIKEGSSFWFGFIHNSELINKTGSLQNDNTKYNFTVEFNPNKLKIKGILLYIIRMLRSNGCVIKSIDMAIDVPVNILDISGFDKGRKKDLRMFTQGGDNKTYYIGRTNNRIKIYNKKIESNLDRELTRIEISTKIDVSLSSYFSYSYDVILPDLYLNNYLLTFDDLKDKTLKCIIYAVQNGYPLSDLSRDYKEKIKNKLLQGGQKLPFNNYCCTIAFRKCIDNIFYSNIIKES